MTFHLVDQDHGRGVLEVQWDVICNSESGHEFRPACESLSWEAADVTKQYLLELWETRDEDDTSHGSPSSPLMQLRKACVDREQWQESFEEEVSSDGAVIA